MKSYVKVPHHEYDVVSSDFFNAPDLTVVEKTDGQNMRIFAYDKRFKDMYTDEILNYDPTHGDIFIGKKKSIQGILHRGNLPGTFNRVVEYLKNTINREEMLCLHEEYDSPLIYFGEHMLKHSLDYDYEDNPPTPYIGFDIYKLSEYNPEKIPANPFEEDFEGFLTISEAKEAFERINLEFIHIIEDCIDPPLDIENYVIPESHYRDGKPEGVVIRSDIMKQRVKYVRPEFKEINTDVWGLIEDQASSGEELFEAKYLTTGRIVKHIHKHSIEHSEIDIEELAESIVYDVWEEMLHDLKSFEKSFTPQKIYACAEKRCETILEQMRTNSQLNDIEIHEVWRGQDRPNITTGMFNITQSEKNAIVETIEDNHLDREKAIVKNLIQEEDIIDETSEIASEKNKEPGNWAIPEVHKRISDQFWIENRAVLANYPKEIHIPTINEEIMSHVASVIQSNF